MKIITARRKLDVKLISGETEGARHNVKARSTISIANKEKALLHSRLIKGGADTP